MHRPFHFLIKKFSDNYDFPVRLDLTLGQFVSLNRENIFYFASIDGGLLDFLSRDELLLMGYEREGRVQCKFFIVQLDKLIVRRNGSCELPIQKVQT